MNGILVSALHAFWEGTAKTKEKHFSCISLKKRFLCDSFPTDKVSGRQAGALKTIEECDGKILWIAKSSW